MKFCPICGKALQDGEVCACQAPHGAPQPDPAQSQPPQPQPQPAQAQKPASSSRFVKALKNIPIAFMSYLRNSDGVIRVAKEKRDWLLPLLYIVILLHVNLIVGVCFFARMGSPYYSMSLGALAGVFGYFGYEYTFQFGAVLLSAFVMTAAQALVYVGARFLSGILFSKKPPIQALFESYIEFGVHSVILSCLLLTGAVLGLIAAWLLVIFTALAASYMVVVYVGAALKDAEGYKNKLIKNAVIAASIAVSVALVFWLSYLMCSVNYFFAGINYNSVDYSGLLNVMN